MSNQKGVFVSYNMLAILGMSGFLFFFGLSIGQWWKTATVFDHILLAGSIVGLGAYGMLFYLPIRMKLTKSASKKEQLEKFMEQQLAKGNYAGTPRDIAAERVSLSDDPFHEDPDEDIGRIIRRET